MDTTNSLIALLDSNGLSVTRPRIEVFKALQMAKEPLKRAEIVSLCKKADRASVYRTLDLFAKLHITNTQIKGWIPFITLAEQFKPHHHHITCINCGQAKPIDSDELEAILHLSAKQLGFTMQRHHIELTGLCQLCAQQRGSQEELALIHNHKS